MKTTSIQLPEEYMEEIEKICKLEGVDKDTIIRKLIGDALREHRVKKALELYSEGKISLWKAAGIAGMTYRAALEELKKRKIPFQYDKEDLDVDIQQALRE